MSDFLSFIKTEHARQQQIKKAPPGQVIRPDEDIPEDAFTDLVWEGERRKLAGQQRPVYKGEKVLDRRPEFTDVIMARSQGMDVRQRDVYDDWVSPDLSAIVDEFLEFLEDVNL